MGFFRSPTLAVALFVFVPRFMKLAQPIMCEGPCVVAGSYRRHLVFADVPGLIGDRQVSNQLCCRERQTRRRLLKGRLFICPRPGLSRQWVIRPGVVERQHAAKVGSRRIP